MRAWHRLHVFAQFLNVLCVIGDVVPVVEYPPWLTTNIAALNTSDPSVEKSSTTSKDWMTRNFQESTITEESNVVSASQHVLDDLSTANPEVTWRTETFVETSTANTQLNKKAGHPLIFATKSLDFIETDLDNVIDTSDDSIIHTENDPNFFITEGPEPLKCVVLEDHLTLRHLDYIENNTTTTTINNDHETKVTDIFVKNLTILESATETLKVSWNHGNNEKLGYEVKWYQKEVLIGTCRIFNGTTGRSVILIKSLKPCTTYRVTVKSIFQPTPVAVATVNGTTDLEVNEDSVKLWIAGVGNEWIELSWAMPCTDCVSRYIINVYDCEKCDEAKIDKTTYNHSGLNPGHSYTFKLTIVKQDDKCGSMNITGETTDLKDEINDCDSAMMMNCSESCTPAVFQNHGATPSKIQQSKDDDIHVEDLRVQETDLTSLKVSWKVPSTSVEVSHYIIEWSKVNNTDPSQCKVSNNTCCYRINSLEQCRTYKVKVTPRLKIAKGSSRGVSAATGLNVSTDSLELKIENGTDRLRISWSMPNFDCLSHFNMSFCEGDNCTEHKIKTNTYFEKKELSPCLTYNFNLTAYGSTSETYGSLNGNGTTGFLAPGKPSPATTISGNYSLFVSWTKPTGHTCVKHYRVVWTRNGKSYDNSTENTSLQLEGLDPCAAYEIIITAVDIYNGDSSQEIISQSNITAPSVTDPPLVVWGPSVTEEEISIKWQIRTNETNNCVPVKLFVECRWNKILGSGYQPLNGKSEYNIFKDTTNKMIDTAVKEISPFTKYDCLSYTFNFGGRSGDSHLVLAETLEAVPKEPTLLAESPNSVTNTSIKLRWKMPLYQPGILRNITILIIWQYNWLNRPSWCAESSGTENITDIDANVTNYVYSARPYSRYNIKIVAATGAGWGPPSSAQIFNTKPGAPGKVTDLNYKFQENPVDKNILDSFVMWKVPCFFNGKNIEYYHIFVKGNRDGFEQHNFTKILNCSLTAITNCSKESYSLMTDQLREEYTYTIQATAKVTEYGELGERSEVTFMYPAGIPPDPSENYTSIISIDPYKARRTTTTATVLLPIFPDTGGVIKWYAIIVSKIGYNNATFGRSNDGTWPSIATWRESLAQDFQIPYQAINFSLDSYQTNIADYGRFKAVKFVLGEDKETCPKISSNKDDRFYCNGPLYPDTVYHVRMRAFTAGGYRDSVVFTVKTNAEIQVAVVIGTIFGILLFGVLMTMMLLVRKCSLQGVLRRFLHSDMPGSPVPAPLTRRKFIAHCQQLADNPGKLSNEYQLLQTLSVDLQMPTNAACLQANRKKNRYTDILPYDFSRVKLEVIDNDPNTDYINASFIKGFTGDEDYVACQGPKEETTYDFWRMIDQYDVKLIVMLTQLVEKNKEKCHQYFPTIRETFTYENMAIRCSMELDYRTYTHRTLILQKENVKRTIIHLHFKDWPDHDVPEDFDPMINFCQIMRRHMEASRGLVVIHCSAGIGRTGTLIAIDILLQHIKDNRKLDVFGTVYRLRHHRINMVQRESQYAYIYNCIRQVLKNPYFSKTYKPPSVDPISVNSHKKKETSDSSTDLVSSFETLKKSSFSTSVESAEPIYQTPPKSRTCYTLNGLRCAKSTGAIDTKPYQQSICRYNTHNHPISDIAKHAVTNSSEISLEITESEGSTTSIYENMHPLSRSKSVHAFEKDEDPCVTQKLLERDTSL